MTDRTAALAEWPGQCDNAVPHGPHQRSEEEACPGVPQGDPRTAALAEALLQDRLAHDPEGPFDGYEKLMLRRSATRQAGRLLAALPADWCGHTGPFAGIPEGWVAIPSTDLARLRRIEEEARAVIAKNALIFGDPNFKGEWVAIPRERFVALRVALEEDR